MVTRHIIPHAARRAAPSIEIKVERHRPLGKWARRAGGALGVAGGGFLSGALALAYYVARRITAPTPPTPFDTFTFTPFEFGVPYESVAFPTGGGATLRGWLLTRPESRRVVITCGGYRGRRADLLGISTALWRDGVNVLIFDYRGHGELAGTPVTLGYQELQDFLAAVDFVKARIPGAAIGALGYSMGASIAIMGAARRRDIAAVVADSPFARQRDAVSLRIRQVLRVPHGPLLTLIDLLLGRLSGYHFRDVEPLREVDLLAPRPLLLIHGGADTITDPHDSAALYAAASEPKELWVLPGIEHCGAYFADRTAYSGRVACFFHRALIVRDMAAGADGAP
jgi:alpha-beta hydrolase superfamily lysophospholipase